MLCCASPRFDVLRCAALCGAVQRGGVVRRRGGVARRRGGVARRGEAWRGAAWRCGALCGVVWRGVRDVAWHGVVWCGVVWVPVSLDDAYTLSALRRWLHHCGVLLLRLGVSSSNVSKPLFDEQVLV